jgi:hypothetical protein
MPQNRIPLVRPSRFAMGGGAASAYGDSGAPGVPTPGSRRAASLAIQYADDERGRFTERIFEFPQFKPLVGGNPPGNTDSQIIEVVSNRTDFVRLVALRGTLQNATVLPLSGLELAQLMLRLQINGEEDLTTSGVVTNPSSFAALFANSAAPWLWFSAPPRLRVGDIIQATVTSIVPESEGATVLTPEVTLRLVDDQWWRALYGS